MQKRHIPQARADGFIIDECCNPPIAYKGPRFQPTEHYPCYTPLESELIKLLPLVKKIADDPTNPLAQQAQDQLAPFAALMAELTPAQG